MMNKDYTQIIGVDVAKQKLDLHASKTNNDSTIAYEVEEVTAYLKQHCKAKGSTLVVMEATGGYESLLVDTLHAKGIDCAVVNPFKVRSFAKALGLIEKNDRIDAQLIARFGEVAKPKLREKPTQSARKLKALVHRRDQILKQVSAENNRKQQTRDSETKAMIGEAIQFYKQQIKEVDRRIVTVQKECPTMSETAEILLSCPGVGAATVGVLLAELPELGQLNRGQIAKLVGVAPIANDSGTKTGRRSTYGGRSIIRKVLYMAALVSTRHNPRYQAFYQKLLAKGKEKKVAIVAIMRKMLVTLNVMVRNKQIWSETKLAVDKN